MFLLLNEIARALSHFNFNEPWGVGRPNSIQSTVLETRLSDTAIKTNDVLGEKMHSFTSFKLSYMGGGGGLAPSKKLFKRARCPSLDERN